MNPVPLFELSASPSGLGGNKSAFAEPKALRLEERIPDRRLKVQRRDRSARKNAPQPGRTGGRDPECLSRFVAHVASPPKSAGSRRKRNVAPPPDLRFLTPTERFFAVLFSRFME
ncbi:hypothetical protein GHK48_27440 [Sinorhizobium fredii]|uniref:Uncharacterized protein n=1 Tax=Rhizobium fredii TaxID=380 RepID=A0A844AIT8_RHIFR|nr:hypothetical protein [Sinorhizobium fredii]MQX11878.1 hypothetical protein [Sinorhizobium fredii]UTY50633.1 hypothetical protein EPK84_29695 [Sinorhizobium fredii]